MSLHAYLLFLPACFALNLAFGPNNLLSVTYGARYGVPAAMAAGLGRLAAFAIMITVSGLGMGTLLLASEAAFTVVKLVGAAYLIWLGVKAWRTPVESPEVEDRPRSGLSGVALYRGGLLTGLSNPKLIVFAAALFPQFITANAPFAPQLAILVITFLLIEGVWYMVYAQGGRRLANWLKPESRQRAFNRLTGAVFIGFGG
ncbi:MAG TPA: LysE family translocator, partial [Burkholderiaceae bacterium]